MSGHPGFEKSLRAVTYAAITACHHSDNQGHAPNCKVTHPMTIRNFQPMIKTLRYQYLSYPGSIDGTGLNPPLESNAMQDVVVCDTICHLLTGELISSLFPYSGVLCEIYV